MVGQVCIIQTTLPGSWIEAEVGAFSQQMLVAGAACYNTHPFVQCTGGKVKLNHLQNGIFN